MTEILDILLSASFWAAILRIAEVVAARPTAAAYDPEPIL